VHCLSLCDEILKLDDRIRFVAHLDKTMKNVLEMKQRPGARSLTDKESDLDVFGFIEPVFVKVCADSEKYFGDLKSVRLNFGKCSIVFVRIPNAVVGVSVEPGPTTPIVEKIGRKYGVKLTQDM
jgi:hypothetical protein